MRIVVLGAGTVGTSIADLLGRHRHSITVVDVDAAKTRQLNQELDVRAITGSASASSILFQAEVSGADLCLAVTGIDEVNLIAASLAKAMGANRSIARVFSSVYQDMSTFDYQRHFNIDRLLSLERLAALEFARGIRNPGSLTVENMAGGELEVEEWVVDPATLAVGKQLRSLKLPAGVRIGCIIRDGKTRIAGAADEVQAGDRVTAIGRRGDVDKIRRTFQKQQIEKKIVVIAGGGETGTHLARLLLGRRTAIVMIEENADQAEYLSRTLDGVTVVHADATRRAVLEEERVGNADVFVATMGDDEENIMAGVEASEVGAKSIMALVGRPDYASVVGKLGIDLAVSPREVMAKQVLSYLNLGPVVTRSHILDSTVSVLELEVSPNTPATEYVLADLQLPTQSLIASVSRDLYVHVPGADDRLKAGDRVIALVEDAQLDPLVSVFKSNAS
jgi:trk system potassium uptake protein TrkA